MPRTQAIRSQNVQGQLVTALQLRDEEVLIGDDLNLTEHEQQAIQETKEFEKKMKTRQDHRNRIKKIYEWLQKNHPKYFFAHDSSGRIMTEADGSFKLYGVRKVTREDTIRNFHNNNSYDLIYSKIGVRFILAFLADEKMAAGKNGHPCSHVHLRKYHNAITFGAEQAGETLPKSYTVEMKKFLASYRKEKKQDELLTSHEVI